MDSMATGRVDTPLLDETIGSAFDRIVALHGDREALVETWSNRRFTYQQLSDEVSALALGLHAAGVRMGDRVAIWAPNCAEWTLVQFATAKLGAILVNINPAYRTHELAYVLNQAGISVIISAPEFKGSDYRAMIEEVRDDCSQLRSAYFLDTSEWDDLLAAGRRGDGDTLRTIARTQTPADPINIQYTSGTTGFPKGATLSHRNLLNNGFFVGEGCGFTHTDRVCIPVPYYHCFGMGMGNLGAMTHGATMVLPSPGFDAQRTLQAVQDERCTALYGVPTMFIAELALPAFADFDLSSLRTGIMAGSPCPIEVMKRVVSDMGMGQVTICYGMTETSPVSTQTGLTDDLDRRTSTVGRVHPHLEIKIVDPVTAEVVQRGGAGEFCTRGYSVMLGYWDQPDVTAEAIDPEGWMHTGDLATMDEDGYVNIVGRIKDMVIRGGENIYPREIEEFLFTHPDIVEAQVVGVPDEEYGEQVMAWIRMRDGAEPLTAESLRVYCTGKLAHYKIPKYVKVVDAFPMTVTGKVRKVEMRQAAIEELGLQRAEAVRLA